jgi:hypothetical protein
VESRAGKTMLHSVAVPSRATPTIQSNWRSWIGGPMSARRCTAASPMAMTGTSAR